MAIKSASEKRAERKAAKAAPALPVVTTDSIAESLAVEGRTAFVWPTHDRIRPDPDNARKDFDEDDLLGLADTIASHGLLQPLVVMPADAQGMHTLVAGERRWRAIGLLIEGGDELAGRALPPEQRWSAEVPIPCRLETAADQARMEAALIENLQRVDLNHMEAGLAFEVLGSRFHLSNKTIAEKIGRSPEYVQQHRRLAGLPEEHQAAMREGELTMHDALQILAKPKPETLGAKTMLLLAEIYHACKHRPAKDAGYSYNPQTEVAHDAAGGELEQLRNRGFVEFDALNYQTFRAYAAVSTYHVDQAFGELLKPLDAGKHLGWVALREYQIAAYPDAIIDPVRGLHKYLTPWLNGPFELSPAAEAKIAAREKSAADQAEVARQREAAKAKAMEDVAALESRWDCEESMGHPTELLAQMVAAGVRFPVRAREMDIVGADGQQLLCVSWHHHATRERLHRLIALSLNLAAGFGAADGAAAPAIEPTPIEAAADDDDIEEAA